MAWLAGSTVYYRIYDPGRSNWIAGSTATPAGFISDPVNDSGLVAWLAGSAVYFAVYDPIGGVWKQSGINNAGASAVSIPKNSGGMLAWVADETVWYVSYDPMTRAWVFNSSAAGAYVVDGDRSLVPVENDVALVGRQFLDGGLRGEVVLAGDRLELPHVPGGDGAGAGPGLNSTFRERKVLIGHHELWIEVVQEGCIASNFQTGWSAGHS